jgi:phosphate transport system protein
MNKHINSQFDEDLKNISTKVLELGGLVENQIASAIYSLTEFDRAAAERVRDIEKKVNTFEVDIDLALSQLIAKRQPNASDLRLILGIGKTVANLERAGDEAARIARMVLLMINEDGPRKMPIAELRLASQLAIALMKRSLDSLARLDVEEAVRVMQEDDQIDAEFDGFMRKLVTFMMEDPRTISPCLDLLFVAKALERIGDHAKNISEIVIYISKGTDIRHQPIEHVKSVIS